MKSLLIGYDLNKPGQNYTDLIDAIKKLGSWWHCLDSTWIIKTELSCVTVRDLLKTYIDTNDKLLVVELKDVAAWTGFDDNCSKWLKDNL